MISSSRFCFYSLLALGLVVALADMTYAQAGGRGRRGGFWGGDGGNMSTLLRDSKVKEELELVDDQIEDLEELQNGARERMMEMFRGGGFGRGMRDMSEEERREKMEEMRAKVSESMKEIDAELGEILLPHQMDRLKQLHFQSNVQRGGTGGFAENNVIADALNITDEQKEKMKEAAEKANKKLQEKIKKLNEQAQEEVLAVLTPEQRKKFKELQGESFEFQSRDRGRGGRADRGGRGERGERGGRRGERRPEGEGKSAEDKKEKSDF